MEQTRGKLVHNAELEVGAGMCEMDPAGCRHTLDALHGREEVCQAREAGRHSLQASRAQLHTCIAAEAEQRQSGKS